MALLAHFVLLLGCGSALSCAPDDVRIDPTLLTALYTFTEGSGTTVYNQVTGSAFGDLTLNEAKTSWLQDSIGVEVTQTSTQLAAALQSDPIFMPIGRLAQSWAVEIWLQPNDPVNQADILSVSYLPTGESSSCGPNKTLAMSFGVAALQPELCAYGAYEGDAKSKQTVLATTATVGVGPSMLVGRGNGYAGDSRVDWWWGDRPATNVTAPKNFFPYAAPELHGEKLWIAVEDGASAWTGKIFRIAIYIDPAAVGTTPTLNDAQFLSHFECGISNSPPSIEPSIQLRTDEDIDLEFDLCMEANCTDFDGDAYTITLQGVAGRGDLFTRANETEEWQLLDSFPALLEGESKLLRYHPYLDENSQVFSNDRKTVTMVPLFNFSYSLSDGSADVNGEVAIMVMPVADPPLPGQVFASIRARGTKTLIVLNASSPDGFDPKVQIDEAWLFTAPHNGGRLYKLGPPVGTGATLPDVTSITIDNDLWTTGTLVAENGELVGLGNNDTALRLGSSSCNKARSACYVIYESGTLAFDPALSGYAHIGTDNFTYTMGYTRTDTGEKVPEDPLNGTIGSVEITLLNFLEATGGSLPAGDRPGEDALGLFSFGAINHDSITIPKDVITVVVTATRGPGQLFLATATQDDNGNVDQAPIAASTTTPITLVAVNASVVGDVVRASFLADPNEFSPAYAEVDYYVTCCGGFQSISSTQLITVDPRNDPPVIEGAVWGATIASDDTVGSVKAQSLESESLALDLLWSDLDATIAANDPYYSPSKEHEVWIEIKGDPSASLQGDAKIRMSDAAKDALVAGNHYLTPNQGTTAYLHKFQCEKSMCMAACKNLTVAGINAGKCLVTLTVNDHSDRLPQAYTVNATFSLEVVAGTILAPTPKQAGLAGGGGFLSEPWQVGLLWGGIALIPLVLAIVGVVCYFKRRKGTKLNRQNTEKKYLHSL